MVSLVNLGKNVFTFLTSLFDVGSDVVNSLDFMGFNVSSKLVDTVTGRDSSSHITNTSITTNLSGVVTNYTDINYRVDHIWGIIGMLSLIHI